MELSHEICTSRCTSDYRRSTRWVHDMKAISLHPASELHVKTSSTWKSPLKTRWASKTLFKKHQNCEHGGKAARTPRHLALYEHWLSFQAALDVPEGGGTARPTGHLNRGGGEAFRVGTCGERQRFEANLHPEFHHHGKFSCGDQL